MKWHLGTMGYGYTDWVGPFYPDKSKSTDFLRLYATQFKALELDTTFYATPPADRIAKWCDAVPDDFRFSVKTLRAVTHDATIDKGLPEMLRFLEAMRGFGPKLDVVLIQFPPTFTSAQQAGLEGFVRRLPTDFRYAIELRDRSWGMSWTLDLLRNHRIALVSAEYLTQPSKLIVTTDFTYIRLIGEHGRYEPMTYERFDPTPKLRWWTGQISHVKSKLTKTWVAFNNDYAGFAPLSLRRFAEMNGIELPSVSMAQPTLFE